MDDKQKKAFLTAAGAIIVLALGMFLYYFVHERTRTTDSDVSVAQKTDAPAAPKDDKADLLGVYSGSDPLEGGGKRLAFFTLSRKDDGSYGGSVKIDTIADATGGDESKFLSCPEVRVGDKEFFLKCLDPAIGEVSFNGEWQRGANGVQAQGKVFWIKDGAVLLEKDTTLTHSAGG